MTVGVAATATPSSKTRCASFWWVNYAWFPARTQASLGHASSRERQPGRKRLIQLLSAVTSQRRPNPRHRRERSRHFKFVLAKYEIRDVPCRASVKAWLESLSWPACADGSHWRNLFVRQGKLLRLSANSTRT